MHVFKKEGIYFPHWYNICLARAVSLQTRRPENAGKVVPRKPREMLSLFARRRSAVRFVDNNPVAHAGIVHIFPLPDKQKIEEVGAVISWGEKGHGYAQEVTTALVRRRRRKNRMHIAMVDEKNVPSRRLFEKKLGGRRMNSSEVPPQAYAEQIPGSTSQEIVFDITNLI